MNVLYQLAIEFEYRNFGFKERTLNIETYFELSLINRVLYFVNSKFKKHKTSKSAFSKKEPIDGTFVRLLNCLSVPFGKRDIQQQLTTHTHNSFDWKNSSLLFN